MCVLFGVSVDDRGSAMHATVSFAACDGLMLVFFGECPLGLREPIGGFVSLVGHAVMMPGSGLVR